MRILVLSLLGSLFVAGCASTNRSGSGLGSPPPRPASPAMGRVAVTTAPPGSSTVTAVTMLEGKVASVNQNLHFVVLDYSFHSLPPLDRRLSVYRQGQKVGEVKVTGPQRAGNIAADILIGEAKEGDEVREN